MATIDRRQVLKMALITSASGGAAGMWMEAVQGADLDERQSVAVDLTYVDKIHRRAQGEALVFEIKVCDQEGQPIKEANIHLWQACSKGKYHFQKLPAVAFDPNFRYWAWFKTNEHGVARIRTIKPAHGRDDTGSLRTPHIRFRVQARGYQELATQMFFAGEILNEVDPVYSQLSATDRKRATLDWRTTAKKESAVPSFHLPLTRSVGRRDIPS